MGVDQPVKVLQFFFDRGQLQVCHRNLPRRSTKTAFLASALGDHALILPMCLLIPTAVLPGDLQEPYPEFEAVWDQIAGRSKERYVVQTNVETLEYGQKSFGVWSGERNRIGCVGRVEDMMFEKLIAE